jgi:hypothetical protein
MPLSLPKTRAGWIGLSTAVLVVLAFLYFTTDVFKGHAVEVSVQNAGTTEIFASIDNTGRHGETTDVMTMLTTGGKTTSPGLRINEGGIRSFGLAVGFFDSPTLHVWEITSTGLADDSKVYDCAFDTIEYSNFKLPSPHVKLKWTGHACKRDGSAQP